MKTSNLSSNTLINTLEYIYNDENIENLDHDFDFFKINNKNSKENNLFPYSKIEPLKGCVAINQYFYKILVARKNTVFVEQIQELIGNQYTVEHIRIMRIIHNKSTMINLFLNMYSSEMFLSIDKNEENSSSVFGKTFYSNHPIKKNSKYRAVLELRYRQSLNCDVRTFKKATMKDIEETNKKKFPEFYHWGKGENTPRRIYKIKNSKKAIKDCWIIHSSKKKHRVNYFSVENYEKLTSSKVGIMYNIILDLNVEMNRYGQLQFNRIDKNQDSIFKSFKSKSSFLKKFQPYFEKESVNIVDQVKNNDSQKCIEKLERILTHSGYTKVNRSDDFKPGYNISIILPKEKYENENISDQHRNSFKDTIIQNITTDTKIDGDSLDKSSIVIKLLQELIIKKFVLTKQLNTEIFGIPKEFHGYSFISFHGKDKAVKSHISSEGEITLEIIDKSSLLEKNIKLKKFLDDNKLIKRMNIQGNCVFYKNENNFHAIVATSYYLFPNIKFIENRLNKSRGIIKKELILNDLYEFKRIHPEFEEVIGNIIDEILKLIEPKLSVLGLKQIMSSQKIKKKAINGKSTFVQFFNEYMMTKKESQQYFPFSNHKGGEFKQYYTSLYDIHYFEWLPGVKDQESNVITSYYEVAENSKSVKRFNKNGHPIRSIISQKKGSFSKLSFNKLLDVDLVRVNQPTVTPILIKIHREFVELMDSSDSDK